MAYKCEIVCDVCGDTSLTVLNKTVSKGTMERYAREDGWHHRRAEGWICADCWQEKFQKSQKLFSKSVLK